MKITIIHLVTFLIVFPFSSFSQDKPDKKSLQLMTDSLRFVTDVPYICRDSVYTNYTVGCGDRIFWKVVKLGKDVVPYLINQLDDTTQTLAEVPNFGGYYTVADVAYVAMQEIIAGIPTFDLMEIEFDSLGCGYCAYWNHLRADISNRKHFQREVRKWEKTLGGRWIDSDSVLTCDCAFRHPNSGHYIREYTLYNNNESGIHIEYSYLKAHSIGLGYNFISESYQPFLGRKINYTFDATLTGIFYNDISALGQRIDFGINLSDLSPDFHLFAEHNDKNDFRIGGKVGVSLGNFIYLHYRYSYPLTSYENSFISRHGFTFTFKMNGVAIESLFGW